MPKIGLPSPVTAEQVGGRDANDNLVPFRFDVQGNLQCSVTGAGSGGTSSSFGSTFPLAGTAAGFIGSTGNMAGANLDADGNLKVYISGQAGGGSAVSIADGADVTQGAKADTAVTNSATTATLIAFVKGLVKILADVWNSGTHKLAVDTGLSVAGLDQEATQLNVLAAVEAVALETTQQDVLTELGNIRADIEGPQPRYGSPEPVGESALQNAATANGDGVSTSVIGYTEVWAIVRGSIGGGSTINWEIASQTAGTWKPVLAINEGTGTVAATTTALGVYRIPVGGASDLRARISSYGSGTITVESARMVAASPALAVIANGGTNLNTSTLALEAGGNLAATATVLGTTSDAKVVGDNTGTVSAKLRGLNYLLNLVTDTVNNWLKVSVQNTTLAVTQSGTWNITNISGTISLPTGASTAAKQPALGTAGTAATDVLTIQGIASMTPLLVTPAANSAINVAQINGVTPLMGAGNTGTGSPRVTIATDQLVLPVGGDVASGSSDSGKPVKIGAIAYSPDGTTPGTAVAEGQRTNAKADLDGRLFINPYSARQGHKHLDGSTAYTDEVVVADPGDGFQVIITNIIVGTNAATLMTFFLEIGSTKIFGPYALEAVAGRGFASGPIYLPITPSEAVTITTNASIAQGIDIDYFIQAV